jgi:TP901 family phage tail tape measure protein
MAQATAGRISAGKAFVEIVADKANLIKGLKSAQRDIKAFGQSLKDLGSDMFILGGFTSVPLLKSIKMFAEFDDRIRTLKGVSGATESTMQDLKETIMDLGATTAFTANQVAEGAIELARIGFEADEVKKAIKPTLDLVRSTGESVNKLGEYAGYASSVLKIFKKNADDFNNVTNIMAYSANRSAMSIVDYYESMKMAGPYAQMVGESIEGASSALMLMANMGVRGSLAGTSLRNVYQVLAATAGKLTDVTDEENNAIATNLESLETLGIRLKDTRGNLLSVAQIMDSIKNKLKEMPKNDKLNFLI